MGKQYTIGCVSVHESASTTHIGATSIEFSLGTEIAGNDSGAMFEEFQAVTRQDPMATINSKSLATWLSFVGLTGQCVGSSFAVTMVDVVTRQVGNCQNSLGSTPHIRDRVTAGLLRLGSLSASRGQDATLSIMLDALTDGTNAPVARTDGVAMPSTIVAERFTLGLCAIDGVTYPEIEDVSIDFGVSITEKTPSLGSIWTDAIGVIQVRPMITLRGRDLSKVSNAIIAAAAGDATHANTVIQLIKRQNAGKFVSFGTSEHIAISAYGLYAPDDLVSASANQRSTHTLRLAAADDGTNAPLLFDLSAAYDTTPP